MEGPIKVIFDYDGTLTAEEEMVEELAQRTPGLDGRRIEPSSGHRLRALLFPLGAENS